MALSQDFLDELHARNDIVDTIGSYVELQQRGRLHLGLCPFHNEKTPSFTVYPDTQSYYCFGCGAGGDVITFIKSYENLEYIEAVKLLAERVGMRMPEDGDQTESDRKRRILEANRLAARFFFSCLNSESGKEARAYLRKRGLSDSTITRFGIGWAPDSWNELRNHLRSKGYRDEELVEAGLCTTGKNGSCYDFFRARVMFPVIDVRGQVVAFSGRTMGGDSRKYVNSRETPVFKKSRTFFGLNIAKNAGTRRVILAEGQMDVITLHQAGFNDAVATLGTAITDEHAKVLSRYVDEVVISYDSDEAGQKATRRAIDTLRAAGLPARVVAIEGGKDPDELIREKGASAYRVLIEKASGTMEYELTRAKLRRNLETEQGRVDYLNDAMAILARCQSPTEREVWAGRVSSETGVDKSTILTGAERAKKSQQRAAQRKEDANFHSSVEKKYNVKSYERQNLGAAAAERRLMALLCAHPDLCAGIQKQIEPEDFVSFEVAEIYKALTASINSGSFNGFSSVASVMDSNLAAVFSGIVAENNNFRFSPQDADFYIEKMLEHKNHLDRDDILSASEDELLKRIKQKRK